MTGCMQPRLQRKQLTPSTSSIYLWIVFNLIKFRAFQALKRIDNLILLNKHFLQQNLMSVWMWLQLLGHLASLEKLVMRGRMSYVASNSNQRRTGNTPRTRIN